MKQKAGHIDVDLKQPASHAEKQQRWKDWNKTSQRQLQQHLHQERLTHEILVTKVGKPVGEYYCMNLRKLL